MESKTYGKLSLDHDQDDVLELESRTMQLSLVLLHGHHVRIPTTKRMHLFVDLRVVPRALVHII